MMNKQEAIAYLTRCADDNGNHWYQGRVWSDPDTCPTCHGSNDAGWLHAPGSRYGRNSALCAEVAWKLARIWSIEDGQSNVYTSGLDHAMSLVVNDSDVPERDIQQYLIALSGVDIEGMVTGYLECQLWAGLDMDRGDENENPPLDENYDVDDISPEYVEQVTRELTEVVTEHPLAVRMYLANRWTRVGDGSSSAHFGHDFYLTREGHGAGFWDRGLGELGDYLTGISKAYGQAEQLWDFGNGVLA